MIGPDIVSGGKLVFPTPVVEVRNAFGGLVQTSGDTIVARSIDPRVHVTGDTVAAIVGGRAVFSRLGVVGPWELVHGVLFTTRGKARADTIEFIVNPTTRLSFNWARINGVLLRHAADTLRAHPNERIAGTLETKYQSNFGAATVVMGMTPTWGRPESSARLASYLLANAGTRVRQDTISLVALEQPGVYFILFAYAPEADERYVLSATNWTMGAPLWGNGDDLASWGIERLTRAAKAGRDSSWVPAMRDGRVEHRWQSYGMTGVTVVVK